MSAAVFFMLIAAFVGYMLHNPLMVLSAIIFAVIFDVMDIDEE